jgi:hypothetical protein
MGSCLVEVRDVCIEDALELPLKEDQQMVEACLPNASQKAFADHIGSGSVIRGLENLNRTRGCYPSKARPEFAIVITNEILGCLPIRSGFSQLLGHPGIGRRSCDANVDHLT